MTTSETVALLPRALDPSELDLVAAGKGGAASFGGIVGWVVGEGIAIAVSVVTLNPAPVIAYQVVAASAGVIVGSIFD